MVRSLRLGQQTKDVVGPGGLPTKGFTAEGSNSPANVNKLGSTIRKNYEIAIS